MYCPHCGVQNDESFKFCKSCGTDLSATLPLDAVKKPEVPDLAEIDLVRGELKDEYEILEELGRGGMAIVFRAREKQLERDVAIKVLPFSLAFDKEFVLRFQREASTAAKLEHPGIIPIYRVGKSGRVIYFVMKFLRGRPLASLLGSRGALPPNEIRQVLVQVARALAYAHRRGTVHRDIKPDNIMFDEHGQALVTDFGIAKAATGGKLTGTGMAIGTPHYMSPEQARAQQLDGRSDIYSLGVVAYQCLTGFVPFDGEDSFSIGYKHIMEELPVPALESQDHRILFEIIRKMLAKLPAERFQTADELVEVLESDAGYVATGISSAQTRAIPSVGFPRLSGVAGAPTTPLPRASASLAGLAPPPRERSIASALLIWVLAVGGIVGGGGYMAYRQGWIFGGPGAVDTPPPLADSTHGLAAADSLGPLADTTQAGGDPPLGGTQPPLGTPGKLVLQGSIPTSARVTMDGQTVRGTQLDLPPGTHTLAVRATGYQPYERQVIIAPGTTITVTVAMQRATTPAIPGGATSGLDRRDAQPCEQYGPSYNQDNMCFDARPTPLTAPYIFLPADAPEMPRLAILLVRVSREGTTEAARVFVGSNVEAFTNQALEFAKHLQWSPALKNGEPVEAWVQLQVLPQRQ